MKRITVAMLLAFLAGVQVHASTGENGSKMNCPAKLDVNSTADSKQVATRKAVATVYPDSGAARGSSQPKSGADKGIKEGT
jgi:hypothetical protein